MRKQGIEFWSESIGLVVVDTYRQNVIIVVAGQEANLLVIAHCHGFELGKEGGRSGRKARRGHGNCGGMGANRMRPDSRPIDEVVKFQIQGC